jgi:hypothetical protein
LQIWPAVHALDRRNEERHKKLDRLNTWRNAIAHQDFSFNEDQRRLIEGDGTRLPILKDVRSWRTACDFLARTLDEVVASHLEGFVGRPW